MHAHTAEKKCEHSGVQAKGMLACHLKFQPKMTCSLHCRVSITTIKYLTDRKHLERYNFEDLRDVNKTCLFPARCVILDYRAWYLLHVRVECGACLAGRVGRLDV